MGLFSRNSNNDQQFYDRRAADVKAAVDKGDIDTAARLAAHLIAEEGVQGLDHLTEAVNRSNKR